MASFVGTSAEHKLMRSLEDVFQIIERTHFFLNTVINSCNGTKGVPFTSADVVLQDELDVISDCMGDSEYETERNIILHYKDVLNIELLSKIVQGGVKEIPDEYNKIFEALFGFMHDMNKHEVAIASFKGSKEADIMAVIGLHLFSQLIPHNGESIEMDAMSTKQNKCPCKLEKCEREVNLTCTAIGSPLTWHGYADIFLNQQIPIVFLEKKQKKGEGDVLIDNCEEQSQNPDEEDDSASPGPRKRRKKLSFEDSEQCKTTRDRKDEVQSSQRVSFLVEDILGQLISQTVTNAFVQVKKNRSLSGWLIPSFGCSSEEVYFFMYDPVNDILLQSSHVISLFLPISGKFDLKAIIIIWIFLNFTAFVKPNLAKEYQLKESNFHNLARNCLWKYKEGTFKQRFKSEQTSLDPQSLLKLLIERGKLAKKQI